MQLTTFLFPEKLGKYSSKHCNFIFNSTIKGIKTLINPLEHSVASWQRIKFSFLIVYLPLPLSNFIFYIIILTQYLGLIHLKYHS